MIHISASVLEIGVPVAKVTPRPAFFRASQRAFMYISAARWLAESYEAGEGEAR